MSKHSRRNKRQIIISPGALACWHVEDKLAPDLPKRLVHEGYVAAKCGVWFRLRDRHPSLKDCRQCVRTGNDNDITVSEPTHYRVRELREVAHLFDKQQRKRLPKSIIEVGHEPPVEPA